MRWRDREGVRWLEARLPGATAAFTTRTGGASDPPYDTLNLGLKTGDDPAAVARNRERAAAAIGRDPKGVVMGRQVHGAELVSHSEPQDPAVYAECELSPEEADAQAVADPSLTPLVLVADCLPVALAGPGGVAMAHAGWRGIAAGVLERAAGEVSATAAAIGPGIGPCCFEVGPEVLERFERHDAAKGRMLDLPEVAAQLLAEAGVGEVERAGHCTMCEGETFFSHRREGPDTGRQGGFAWLGEA